MSTLEERIAAYEQPQCNILDGFNHEKLVSSGLGLLCVGLFIMYKDLMSEAWAWKEIMLIFWAVWLISWTVIHFRLKKKDEKPKVVKRGIE
ncbi:hypothetical protein CJU89_6457 [Yarrowia sp. B02]|nr:hypothetical protein CJU89_6457 [Yarrowia sp. B02]